jgi:predicted nucleic acid-binding protein
MAARIADSAIEDFRRWSSGNCEVIVPASGDFDSAVDLVRDYASGLRAPDALHLAIARNWGNLSVVTFDAALNAAASRLGIKLEKL